MVRGLDSRGLAVKQQIPPERRAAFASVAAISTSERVLVVCGSETVRRQYERAITALGGDLNNVVFRLLDEAPPKERTPR